MTPIPPRDDHPPIPNSPTDDHPSTMVSLDVLVNYAPPITDSHCEMDNLDDHTTFSSSRWEALAAMDLT